MVAMLINGSDVKCVFPPCPWALAAALYRREEPREARFSVQLQEVKSGGLTFNPSTPRVINFKFPLHAHQKYNITQNGELWLFIAYSDERWLYYKFSLPHLCIFSLKGWENVLFELKSERVKALVKRYRNSSRLEPRFQLGWSWVSFGHQFGSNWQELDQVGLNLIKLNFSPNSS